jgi:membrane fusion protein (multidrug efflux system)
MSHKTSLSLAGLALAACVAYGAWHLVASDARQDTDDAYIRADSVLVAPRVAGQISEVAVQDNQRVKAGQLLARLDDSDYLAAQAATAATLAGARAELRNLDASIARQQAVIEQTAATTRASAANLKYAQANAQRYRNLSSSGAGTQQESQRSDAELRGAEAARDRDAAAQVAAARSLDVLKAQREMAEASVQHAQAALRQADLNVAYTRITAPQDGMVGQRSARVGAYVPMGTPLMAVVPLDDIYVVANFRETQLADMRGAHVGQLRLAKVGDHVDIVEQPVEIRVDSHPGQRFKGHLQSLSPATGLSFSAIAPDNATGNFTKIAQRIPVKIVFEPGQPHMDALRVGMSAVVDVDTREGH